MTNEPTLLGGARRHAPLRTEAGKRSGREPRSFPKPIRRNPGAPRPTADHALAVYDGQQRIGSVVERNGEFLVFDIHDRRVGVFTNQREALRAIPAARSS
jgi:hypothetical protein